MTLKNNGLTLCNVTLAYPGNKLETIKNISLSLPDGKIGCIMGASGSGKTTLLRAIAGFEKINCGSISVKNRTISAPEKHLPVQDRKIGFVFQENALYPHLTVKQNITFGLKFGTPTKKTLSADLLISKLDLQPIVNNMPNEISGGQQQRTALARALINGPELLLMDEPFSSLDRNLRENITAEVRTLLQEQQITTIFVTHDYIEASTLSDFIGVLEEGQMQQWGTEEELYKKPSNIYVAKTIGDGVILSASEYVQLFQHSTEFKAFILRPENVKIDHSGVFTATVTKRIGNGHLLTLRINPSDIKVQAYSSIRPSPKFGDILRVNINRNECLPIRE